MIKFSKKLNISFPHPPPLLELLTFSVFFLSILGTPHLGWANHGTAPIPKPSQLDQSPDTVSAQEEEGKGFFYLINSRLSGELKLQILKSQSGYYLYEDPDQPDPFSPELKDQYYRERLGTAQDALQTTALKTINDIRFITVAREYLEGLTQARLVISDEVSFEGPSISGANHRSDEKNESDVIISKLSIVELPYPGISLQTSYRLIQSNLNYLPLNQYPFVVRLEHPFLLDSKIGLNYRWSVGENGLLTTILVPF